MFARYYGNGDPTERMQYFIANPPPVISVDVETVSIAERIPLGFAIAFSADEAVYISVYPTAPEELAKLATLLCNSQVRKVAHNAIFDLGILPTIPHLAQLDRSNIWDTNVAARYLGREFTDLPYLAELELTDIKVTAARDMLKGKKSMLEIDAELLADKCQRDARACLMLYQRYLPPIEAQHKDNFAVDMKVMPILIDMSQRGLLIDQTARAALQQRYSREVDFYKQQVLGFGVENPASSQQVGYMLAKRGNFLPLTKSKKQLSTRVGELEFLDDPMAAAVLGYRHYSKFKNTYLDPLEGEDRFFTEYYLDTSVGRLNSRDRNIQNIPLDARYMILPDNGLFTSADYSQEHLYILMHFSQDRAMKQVYEEGLFSGDIHSYTAEQMFGSVTPDRRKLAKTINYAICYGATPKTISEQSKIRDRTVCSRLLDNWFRTFKGAADWIQTVQREGLRSGWAEPTLFGRRIKLPEESEDGQRRKAVNFPILGSDGEVIKRAIIRCSELQLGPPVLAITVHDSLHFDGDIEVPVEELEMIPGFKIPVQVTKTLHWE